MHKTSEWLLTFAEEASKRSTLAKFKKTFRPCIKISITGGKGGVGKTSVALKTAQELARADFRVLLIDCDSNLSNTAIKLGLPVDNRFEQLLSSFITFEECLIQRGKFHLLAGCNGSLDIFESKLKLDEVIGDIISSHQHEYDFILLDCPAGLGRDVLALNAICDYRFVVVTPDRSSITDSYSLIKILSQKYGIKENHLLVNMHQGEKQYSKVVSTMSETVGNFLGGQIHALGGIRKLDVGSSGFDTFFLSDEKNEWNKNFVKLLYGFTEKIGESGNPTTVGSGRSFEQDVH